MTAVYVGAGQDMRPVNDFKHIHTFYYMDGQPNSEFGVMRSKEWKDGQWTGKFTNGFSRPYFIPELDKTMLKINMKLVNVKNNLRTYTNGKQTVHYYTNTAMPEHYDNMKKIINKFDTLIVAGHDPDSIFLNATKNKIHFIGYENTSYVNDAFDPNDPTYINEYVENYNSAVYRLHNDNIQQKFSKFSYVENNKNICDFNHWNDFYTYSEKKNN